MVLDEVMNELTGLVSSLPEEVSDNLLDLILVLKALGIAAIIYVIYVVVSGFFTYLRMKKVDSIEKKTGEIEGKVNSIDNKLNKLLNIIKKKKN